MSSCDVSSPQVGSEPFGLTERFEKLHNHWYTLQRREDKPEKWEVEHDTTFLSPLLKQTGLDGEWTGKMDDGLTGMLSEEQKEKMEGSYSEWKTDRDLKVAYLKINPPRPMAWVPVPTNNEGKRAAWEDVVNGGMEGGIEDAGKRVDGRLLASSPRWKPIYRDLITEDIPMSWLSRRYDDMTSEESDHLVAKIKKDMELRLGRSRKQKDLQESLKTKKKQTQGSKNEL